MLVNPARRMGGTHDAAHGIRENSQKKGAGKKTTPLPKGTRGLLEKSEGEQ